MSWSSGDPFANMSDEELDHLSSEFLAGGLVICYRNEHKLAVKRIWEKLSERHDKHVLHYVYSLLRHSHLQGGADARDLTDTIFIKAFIDLVTTRTPDDFAKPGSSFKGWIDTIARNEVLKHWKETGRYSSLDALTEEGQEPLPAGTLPIYPPEDSERQIAIEEAISKLPPREAEVFKLVFYDRMTVKQIATRLNISERAAQQALFRGRKRFKELYNGPRLTTSKRKKARRRSPSPLRSTQHQSDDPGFK